MSAKPSILFVCLHGSAKSLIAAYHMKRLATERGIEMMSESAGVEPDDVVPPHVVAGLADDGIDVTMVRPKSVTSDLMKHASHIVSFGCDLSAFGVASGDVTLWKGVPDVSDGYQDARSDIVARVEALLKEVLAKPVFE